MEVGVLYLELPPEVFLLLSEDGLPPSLLLTLHPPHLLLPLSQCLPQLPDPRLNGAALRGRRH